MLPKWSIYYIRRFQKSSAAKRNVILLRNHIAGITYGTAMVYKLLNSTYGKNKSVQM